MAQSREQGQEEKGALGDIEQNCFGGLLTLITFFGATFSLLTLAIILMF